MLESEAVVNQDMPTRNEMANSNIEGDPISQKTTWDWQQFT